MSGELFSDDDARILDDMLVPVDGMAVDPDRLPPEPATHPVSQELLRFSHSIGNEGLLLVHGLPQLSLETRQQLSRSIMALRELPFVDQNTTDQLEVATQALAAWGGNFYATVRMPLALGSNALRSIHRLGEKRVAIVGAALTRFCGLPLPEYPSPEYAAYFSESLDEIPAHIVRGFGDAREARPIPHAVMTQCLTGEVPLPAWAEAQGRGGMSAMEYIKDYERRFMMARGIFASFISTDEDLGID